MSGGEHADKRRRLLALLDEQDLDALVLRRTANLSWYSGGGRFHIVATPEVAVADMVVTRDGDQLVTAVNEAPRLEAEELAGLDVDVRVLPWPRDRNATLPTGDRIGSDGTLFGSRDVSALVEQARRSLTPAEIGRYQALGWDAAAALTKACSAALPSHSEHDAAAATAAALLERSMGNVFADGVAAYERRGFAPDEWQRHHQGGPTGYEPRDYIADFSSTARIEANQAFAWNPSVPGLKSEDTILARDGGPEILTVDPSWPTALVAGLRRPLVLER